MTKSLTIGAILGGVVVFVWSAISWMVIPWHEKTMSRFKDEKVVGETILANTERSGVYFLPWDGNALARGPIVYAAIRRQGMSGMTKELATSFVLDFVSAGLIMWLLLQTAGRTFMGKVGFIVVVAVAVGVIARLADWNWWGFPAGYTMVSIAELIIGWFLAGLVMAKFAPQASPPV